MSKYIGQPCTSCRNVFKDGDDIVVCPECGSPYHKECYKAEGRCINTVLHESGGEWHPEPIVSAETTAGSDMVCPNCGSHNPPGSLFCTNCGISLTSDRPYRPETAPQVNPQPGQFDPYGGYRPGMPPFVNVRTVSAETVVDSNTVGEYSKYVGQKYYYYIPKFLKFAKTGSKISFNVPAFFVTPFWFFYRKMPIYGILTFVLMVVTSIPTMMEYALIDSGMSVLENDGFAIATLICSLINWVMTFASAFFGNYLYYKKAKADIDEIKAQEPDASKRDALIQSKGGTSFLSLGISIAALFIVSFILSAYFTSRTIRG